MKQINKVLESENAIITSNFGNRSLLYQGKLVKSFHTGIDLVCDPRDNKAAILAIADGEVVSIQNKGSQYGKPCFVRIKHSDNVYSLYYHLKNESIVVRKGDMVKKGDILGIIGATGKATGIHLHFQIDDGNINNAIDPYDYIFGDKNIEILYQDNNDTNNSLYYTLDDMYIKHGPSTKYATKLTKDMSLDGKKNAKYSDPYSYAVYKKGTKFTVKEMYEGSEGIWARTPSGWVCVRGKSGKVYCKPC